MTVVILSAAQLVALPSIGSERLILRLAATRDDAGVRRLIRTAHRQVFAMACVTLLCAIVSVILRPGLVLSILAVGVTACMVVIITIRQAYNRGIGNMLWGQVPNEVVKPFFIIFGFLLVSHMRLHENTGAIAALLGSAAALVVGMFIPIPARRPGEERSRLGRTQKTPAVTSSANWMLLLAGSSTAIDRIYPMLLGAFSTTTQVTALAVAMRILQLGGFGLGIGNFVYSPPLAKAMQDNAHDFLNAGRLVRHIRLVALVTAAPIAIACVVAPGLVTDLLGDNSLNLDSLLFVAAVALILNSASGPIQTLMLMAGRERIVALSVTIALVGGAAAGVILGQWSAMSAFIAQTVSLIIWNIILHISARRTYGTFM